MHASPCRIASSPSAWTLPHYLPSTAERSAVIGCMGWTNMRAEMESQGCSKGILGVCQCVLRKEAPRGRLPHL